MKKTSLVLLVFLAFIQSDLLAQLPNCTGNPSTIIYIQSGSTIRNYDVTQPISATNPSVNTITMPPGAGGLAVSNNLNSVTGPSPTFYTSVSNNWWYYDGTAWVNTGHSCGSTAAVNSGGGGNYLYNLVGSSGQVYQYDGTSNSTLLLTVPGFSGGGPYDLVGDCDGGFYILRTNPTNSSWLRKYSSTGALAQSWTATGSSNSAGGGFAIANNTVYYHNGGGFRSAPFTAPSTNLAFAPNPNTIPGPSDMAVCRVCDSTFVSPPPPNADFGMSRDTICVGDCIAFTDLSTDTPTAWSWTFPTGTPPATNIQNPTNICFNTPGTHAIQLIATNAGGSDTSIKNLYVSPVPTAGISGNLSICSGQSTTLTATPASGVTYVWSNAATTQSITVSPTVTTVYSVIVSNGICADTAQVTVNVTPQPVAQIAAPSEICLGQPLSLTAAPAGITYLWSTSETTQTINPNPTTTTTYMVYTINGSCIDSTAQTVVVNPLPVATLTPQLTDCDADNGRVVAVGSGGTPGYSYLWSNTQTGTTAFNLGVGTYTVTITDTKNCSSTASANVGIHPNPVATISPYPIAIVRIGETIQLNAGGGKIYNWSPSIYLSCSDCPNPIALPKDENIVYCVDVEDENGCRDTACTTVQVDTSCSNIFIPTGFTPNGDGLNDYISIQNTCDIENLNFRIFNRWGQLVFETNDVNKKWDGTFNGNEQPTSTFFYVLKAELINGRSISLRGDITLIR